MNNTIFDDVFRTMIEKMPYLAIPLINDVFHTSYPEDVKMTKLIVKIADYIFRREEDVRKGIGDIMGGKVLELESERLKAEGRTEGEAIGQARGEAIGQIQGETRLGSLITRLLQDQRTEEIPIVSTDAKRREQLYKEYNL